MLKYFWTDRACTKIFNNKNYLKARIDRCTSGTFMPSVQVSVRAEKTDLAIVTLEDTTVCVLLERSAIFISFWCDASSSRSCSSSTLALFSNVDSDGFLAISSTAVSRHFVTRSLERRLKQLEVDVQRGQEEAVEKAAYNFRCSSSWL